MKIKILLSSVLLIAAAAFLITEYCPSHDEQAYVPRSEAHTAQGIEGAMEYYRSIRSNIYTGEIELEDGFQMRKALEVYDKKNKNKKNADINWTSMGPDNVGGRTRAILPFPNDPNVLIAGGVSGGLFKSTTAGQNWTRLVNFKDNLAVSSIAMLGNGSIYVGTGHTREGVNANFSSGFPGGGLFVSNDQGTTWNLVSDFEPQPFNLNDDWTYINKLIADPSDPNRLWIGNNFGLYSFNHGGTDLNPSPAGINQQRIQDFDVSADGQNIFVMSGPRPYVSTDFGQSFSAVTDGIFTLEGNGATDVAISPRNKNLMVAAVPYGSQVMGGPPFGSLKSIYASTNAGSTWNIIAPNVNTSSGGFVPYGDNNQGWYDNMITFAPNLDQNGAEKIIMGGIRLYQYTLPENVTPGIFLWELINDNFSSGPGQIPSGNYVHSDIHTSAIDALGRLYIGCDGGIFRSSNNGQTWSDLNRNYITTQYYNVAFSPTGQVLGGLQDNSSLYLRLDGATPEQAIRVLGGDGFACAISQSYPNFLFASSQFGSYARSIDNGENISLLNVYDDQSNPGQFDNDFYSDLAFHEHPKNQFSEILIPYTPNSADVNLEFFAPDEFQVTEKGDTIIGRVPAGTQIVVSGTDSPNQYPLVLEEDINYYSYFVRISNGDSIGVVDVADTAFVQETAQYLLACPVSNGVFVTREPLKTNGIPEFVRLSSGEAGSNPTCAEFSPDGNHLYVGYDNGRLIRFTGFNNSWRSEELTLGNAAYSILKSTIYQGQGAITDVEVDYSLGYGTIAEGDASERVAITIGNYGGSGKVRVSNVAATTIGTNSFTNIWNVPEEFIGMPCYAVVMDKDDPNVILVGTEYGMWYTGDNGVTWSNANNGTMNRVPIFDLRQQKLKDYQVQNSGVVYAGSHGRGVFRTDYLLDINTSVGEEPYRKESMAELNIYPNPISNGRATVEFTLDSPSDVSLAVYSLDGRLVMQENRNRMDAGVNRRLAFDSAQLPAGTYILQVRTGDKSATGKFIKTN